MAAAAAGLDATALTTPAVVTVTGFATTAVALATAADLTGIGDADTGVGQATVAEACACTIAFVLLQATLVDDKVTTGFSITARTAGAIAKGVALELVMSTFVCLRAEFERVEVLVAELEVPPSGSAIEQELPAPGAGLAALLPRPP